jgi:hypothetical protein
MTTQRSQIEFPKETRSIDEMCAIGARVWDKTGSYYYLSAYVNAGVIEVHHGHYTPQLRDTKSQTLRWYSGRNNSGTSERCAAAVARRAARASAAEMRTQYRASMAAGYCAAVAERSPNDEL